MYKTTEKKQYEKPKMKVQLVKAQATLMQESLPDSLKICVEGGDC